MSEDESMFPDLVSVDWDALPMLGVRAIVQTVWGDEPCYLRGRSRTPGMVYVEMINGGHQGLISVDPARILL